MEVSSKFLVPKTSEENPDANLNLQTVLVSLFVSHAVIIVIDDNVDNKLYERWNEDAISYYHLISRLHH